MAEEKNEELQTEETEQTKVEDGHGDSAEQEETENNSGSEVEEQEEPEVHPLEIELNELKDRLARVRADYENFRRRTKEEKEAQAKYRAQGFIEKLLPALDNFERALLVEPKHEEAKQLLQGMEMVYRQVEEALKQEGVEPIPTEGELFDPHLHQAVMQVSEEGYEPNQIVEELQKGYKLKDRVIRHSMVKVNQ
ncbi:nucleotide exchange factor GrpE [Shouchella clausii]|uniref:Protein GrpE n=1 Tax=Shouchella clausii TaxID=79880 RepID=A0A268S537_SHOCL|nr:nucleotide exchange factor GrpE [Shouchella clausii]PAD43621.1 nucleotide exchange factor GrpE [Bacillus sp. 7520-S]AST98112.1 nucleotide exchange factor GrpE [Shouchella clausii]MBU8595342.1 nucleotide exchange factor GrpE [Shouchella clausii]MCR1286907.1 nucleotide exchange factor GrpE [Shouchella clausii]MCY1103401.1 nucleotide exchange factor GrpE [Shouchella clausii]